MAHHLYSCNSQRVMFLTGMNYTKCIKEITIKFMLQSISLNDIIIASLGFCISDTERCLDTKQGSFCCIKLLMFSLPPYPISTHLPTASKNNSMNANSTDYNTSINFTLP